VEADWDVEVGSGAPVIDALWEGFVDLRLAPERISEIEEAQGFLPLQRALLALNLAGSAIWTAKCDLWALQDFDPSEMEAPEPEAGLGLGCYIDLLPRSGRVFSSIAQAEEWVRKLVAELKQVNARCCRVDLVIRQAISGQIEGFGVTAYITACGADAEGAKIFLGVALEGFVRLCEAAFEPTSEAIQ
jgi:hypothetical protein